MAKNGQKWPKDCSFTKCGSHRRICVEDIKGRKRNDELTSAPWTAWFCGSPSGSFLPGTRTAPHSATNSRWRCRICKLQRKKQKMEKKGKKLMKLMKLMLMTNIDDGIRGARRRQSPIPGTVHSASTDTGPTFSTPESDPFPGIQPERAKEIGTTRRIIREENEDKYSAKPKYGRLRGKS